MISRILRGDLQDWLHEQVDRFILQQAQLRQNKLEWVKEEVLYMDIANDQ